MKTLYILLTLILSGCNTNWFPENQAVVLQVHRRDRTKFDKFDWVDIYLIENISTHKRYLAISLDGIVHLKEIVTYTNIDAMPILWNNNGINIYQKNMKTKRILPHYGEHIIER